MLQKFWGAKEKMKNEKNIWWEENKKREKKEKKKEKKWEGNKIKLRKIIKMLLGSFCFISSQMHWWQIHTQIFQPCGIR
jgi:hypothetical protein